MPYKYVFDSVAAEEYEAAFLWYQNQSEISGDRLIIEVQEAIDKICDDPYRYRNNYKSIRETALKKFPYSIAYLIDEAKKQIVIISLFHHRRNPRKKYRK
jgi:plasmid stabilization system protein ParE